MATNTCYACKLQSDEPICGLCLSRGRDYLKTCEARLSKCFNCKRRVATVLLAQHHGFCNWCVGFAEKKQRPLNDVRRPPGCVTVTPGGPTVNATPKNNSAKPVLVTAVKPVAVVKPAAPEVRMKAAAREPINKSLRYQVWITYGSAESLFTACYCCEKQIEINAYHCGHVMASAHGGRSKLANLRPVCASCNLSMGTKNMRDFIVDCGFRGRFVDEKPIDKEKLATLRRRASAMTEFVIVIDPAADEPAIVNKETEQITVLDELRDSSTNSMSSWKATLRHWWGRVFRRA